MPPVQAGSPLGTPEQFHVNFGYGGPTTTSTFVITARNTNLNAQWLITNIDATATQFEPVQAFFQAALWPNSLTTGPIFYYDSQSTGEGLGIWFSWRGTLPLAPNDAVSIKGTSVSNLAWGGVISGIVVPYMAYVH